MFLQTDMIRQVGDLWQGSVLSTAASGGDFAPIVFSGHNNAVAILLICIAFLTIVMFRTVAMSVAGSVIAVFSENRREEIYNDASYTSLAFLTTVLLIPIFAFVLFWTKASTLDYWMILMIIAALFIYRAAVFATMAWTSGDKGVYDIKKFSDSAFIILMLAAIPICLVSIVFRNMPAQAARIYLLVVSMVCLVPYLISATKKIISLRFSRFFAFLYLCAIEFLPLAVVVKLVIFKD